MVATAYGMMHRYPTTIKVTVRTRIFADTEAPILSYRNVQGTHYIAAILTKVFPSSTSDSSDSSPGKSSSSSIVPMRSILVVCVFSR